MNAPAPCGCRTLRLAFGRAFAFLLSDRARSRTLNIERIKCKPFYGYYDAHMDWVIVTGSLPGKPNPDA